MLPFVRPLVPNLDALAPDFRNIFESRRLSNGGPYVQKFEQQIAEFCGVKHALAFCNGQTALMVMLKAANVHGGVIVPAFTFKGTASAVKWAGATPLFVDCEPDTFTINPDYIRGLRDAHVSAILAAPVCGNPCDNDKLQDIADGWGIPLLYDSASGFGSYYHSERLGPFGDAEIFSFHATKIFSTIEGGALTTNDDALAARAREMRNFSACGLNGKMSEIVAAMGLSALDGFSDVLFERGRRADYYRRELKCVEVQRTRLHTHSNSTFMIVLVDDAERFVSRMAGYGVETRRMLDWLLAPLPVATDVANRAVALPFYPDMSLEEVNTVVQAVRESIR